MEENFSIVPPLIIVDATNVIQAEIAFVNSTAFAIVAAQIVVQIDCTADSIARINSVSLPYLSYCLCNRPV